MKNLKTILLLATLTFLSCSKKDDAPQRATAGLDYDVPFQYTINGVSYSGTAS